MILKLVSIFLKHPLRNMYVSKAFWNIETMYTSCFTAMWLISSHVDRCYVVKLGIKKESSRTDTIPWIKAHIQLSNTGMLSNRLCQHNVSGFLCILCLCSSFYPLRGQTCIWSSIFESKIVIGYCCKLYDTFPEWTSSNFFLLLCCFIFLVQLFNFFIIYKKYIW